MDNFYSVVILICVLSMITLAIDIGQNTILNKSDIKWFRTSFIFVVIGAILEWLGSYFDYNTDVNKTFHALITCIEFSISPLLAILLARSCGSFKTLKPMSIFMGIHVLCEFISLPFGWIFYIDINGKFQRGSAYWIYIISCLISFIYIMIVLAHISKKAKLNNKIVPIIIAIIMIFGQSMVLVDSRIQTGYLSTSITAILLYIYIQNFLRFQMIQTIDMEKEIVNTDTLTGVSSRNSFERKTIELNKLIQENRDSLKFAICECDLNNLKLINDSFGHDIGDLYIKTCCRTICNIFKHSPVYRIGGDEFVIILQNEEYKNMEDLKNIIYNFTMAEALKQVDMFEKQFFASGFAEFDNTKDESVKDVLRRADAEMYINKKEFKKHVVYN